MFKIKNFSLLKYAEIATAVIVTLVCFIIFKNEFKTIVYPLIFIVSYFMAQLVFDLFFSWISREKTYLMECRVHYYGHNKEEKEIALKGLEAVFGFSSNTGPDDDPFDGYTLYIEDDEQKNPSYRYGHILSIVNPGFGLKAKEAYLKSKETGLLTQVTVDQHINYVHWIVISSKKFKQ